MVLKVRVQKLVDDMPAAFGQAFAHILAGVLAGNQPADVNQLQKRAFVPAVQPGGGRVPALDERQLLHRIVDEGGQLNADFLGYRGSQDRVNFFPDNAGRRVKDVDERLVLTVQVADIVFGAFWQLGHGFKPDNLAGSSPLRGKIPRKER